MLDQATALRGLVVDKQPNANHHSSGDDAHGQMVSFVSGKGGVGKSVLCLNLAVLLAKQGKTVCVVDACLGLGQLDLMCGLNGHWNLSHVLTGARKLSQVFLRGPAGIQIVSGSSGIAELADVGESTRRELQKQIHNLQKDFDFVLVDHSSGVTPFVLSLAELSDRVLLITTPEPTSIADAYSMVKIIHPHETPQIELVVNEVTSGELAGKIAMRIQDTARMFAKSHVGYAGHVRHDQAVIDSVYKQQPFAETARDCPATIDCKELAEHMAQPIRHRRRA